MKKTLGLLLLLGALSFLAYKVLTNKEKKSSLDLYDRSFAVENLDDLGRIVIARKNKPVVQLNKKNNRWNVNDKFLVGQSEMKSLTDVLEQMRLKYIPHPNAIPNIINEMAVIGIKVDLYNRQNKRIKSYYVGGGTSDERGTYLLMDGADQPYVMDMAKYEGSIRGRFLLTEKEWRDRTFLEEDPASIKSITVEYPKEKERSFVLDVENDEVAPTFQYSLKKKQRPRKGSVKAYLREFEKIGSEFIDNDNLYRDSIVRSEPFCILTIDYKEQEQKQLRFFPLGNTLVQKPGALRWNEKKNVERYFADCSWGEFLLVQQLLVGDLLQSIDFFY